MMEEILATDYYCGYPGGPSCISDAEVISRCQAFLAAVLLSYAAIWAINRTLRRR